jgi:hypothetical protein
MTVKKKDDGVQKTYLQSIIERKEGRTSSPSLIQQNQDWLQQVGHGQGGGR